MVIPNIKQNQKLRLKLKINRCWRSEISQTPPALSQCWQRDPGRSSTHPQRAQVKLLLRCIRVRAAFS